MKSFRTIALTLLTFMTQATTLARDRDAPARDFLRGLHAHNFGYAISILEAAWCSNDKSIFNNSCGGIYSPLDSLLCIAASKEEFHNDLTLFDLLLKWGANANARTVGDHTPLFLACEAENDPVALVKLLVETGNADYNAQGAIGQNPLMKACWCNNPKIVAYLLSLPGIDITLTNIYGETAVDIAKKRAQYVQTEDEKAKNKRCISLLEEAITKKTV